MGKDLWVGAGEIGFCKRKGKKLEVIKDTVPAEQIDSREGLVGAANDFAGSTMDGSDFSGTEASEILESLEDKSPLWR